MSRSVWSCRTTLERWWEKKKKAKLWNQSSTSDKCTNTVRIRPQHQAPSNTSKKRLQRSFLLRFNVSEKWEEETLPAAWFCFPLATKNISLLPLFWSPTALQVLVFFWPPPLAVQRALCGVCLGSPLRQLWLIQCSSSWVNSLIRSLSFFMKWLFPQEKWERLKQYCASIWHTASRMFTLNQVAWNCSRPMA